jgi:hypothetical protein
MNISLPYLAGLFDGEGSIGLYPHHRGRLTLRTQLTQNKNKNTFPLLRELMWRYGGSLPPQKSSSGKTKVNWQLNSQKALRLLQDIHPYMIIKKEQASLAINWQVNRPEPSRNKKGHFVAYPDTAKDREVARILKWMKRRKR